MARRSLVVFATFMCVVLGKPTLTYAQRGFVDAGYPGVLRQLLPHGERLAPQNAMRARASHAGREVHIVFPTGVFPDDVLNVQAVVDDLGLRGVDGKIVLQARNIHGIETPFNFGQGDYFAGDRWFVYVWSNSAIFGQDTGNVAFVGVRDGSAQTTVVGGLQSLACFRATKCEVRAIRFEGAELAPILVFRADSATIRDNEIRDVRGDPFGVGTYGEPKAVGIWVAANLEALDNIKGHIEIKDNRIYDVVADSADGIAIVATNASFEIKGNEIENVNRLGIFTIWNQKPIVIKNNVIVPGPGNTPSEVGNNAGFGILTSFPIGDEATIQVKGNRVICENPNAVGIAADGGLDLFFDPEGTEMFLTKSVFKENHITMIDTVAGGMEFYAADGPGFFNNEVVGNLIEGTAAYGIYAGGYAIGLPNSLEPKLYNNLFKENDLSGFSSQTGWDVILDWYTESNSYFGASETVLDLGTGNVIVLDD